MSDIEDFMRAYTNTPKNPKGMNMSNEQKPRRVKAKITRTVTEIAIVLLDNDGNVEDVEDTIDTIAYDNCVIHEIRTVISTR